MKIKYGLPNNNIDVTDICKDNFLTNNIITIPGGNTNSLFTDPIKNVKKKIIIEKDDIITEYDENTEVKITINELETNEIDLDNKVDNKQNLRVAIAFFGITRSLKYTIESIENKVFHSFKKNNIEYDVFIHTYHLTNYKNIRTGEKITDDEINNEEYKLLNPDFIEIDVQETIKEKLNLKSYRRRRDPWKNNYNSVDNFILGQYSKYKVTNMIQKQIEDKVKYDYIIFMRPDCKYIDNFPIDCLKSVTDNTIVIPNFALFGPSKFNDRFCITNNKTYKLYGDFFLKLLELSKKQPLHSETIMGYVMIKQHKLNVKRVKFNFNRVRFNGKEQDDK